MSNLPATTNGNQSLVAKFANKYSIEPEKLMNTLKATAFKLPNGKDGKPQYATNEQMAALLVVADQYGLNPFTREIYAFPDRNKGIVPIVGVDGWTRIVNESPAYDGVEFKYADEVIKIDKNAKECPAWIEAVFYRKDRTRPIVIREYLEECYKPSGNYPGPWQSHTKRFLRHKAFIQGARMAFGFAGIYDEDEAKGFIDLPQDPGTDIDLTELSEKLLASFNEADHDLVLQFVEQCANVNGRNLSGMLEGAIGQIDSFKAAFDKWKANNTPADDPADEPDPEETKAQALARRAEEEMAEKRAKEDAAAQKKAEPEPAEQGDEPEIDFKAQAVHLVGVHAKKLDLDEDMVETVQRGIEAHLNQEEAREMCTGLPAGRKKWINRILDRKDAANAA